MSNPPVDSTMNASSGKHLQETLRAIFDLLVRALYFPSPLRSVAVFYTYFSRRIQKLGRADFDDLHLDIVLGVGEASRVPVRRC